LETDTGSHAGSSCRLGRFLRLSDVAPQWPFAHDMLTGFQRGHHHVEMEGYSHTHGDDIDIVASDELVEVIISS
jgi:hypothetical protein